jgi:hypothetical protein
MLLVHIIGSIGKFEAAHILCHSGSKFCKLQSFKFKNVLQAMLWNGHGESRIAASYRGQIIIEGQICMTCARLSWRYERIFNEKRIMEFEDLFSEDEKMNQIACVAEIFGFLAEPNVSLQECT